jgi:hypothetical protein
MIVEYYFYAIIINFRDDDGIIGKKTEVCGRDACAVMDGGDGPRCSTAFCIES